MIIWQCPIVWKLWKIRMKADLWFLILICLAVLLVERLWNVR